MPTHDKTIFCKQCRNFRNLREKFVKSACRDCGSYASRFSFYVLAHHSALNSDYKQAIAKLQTENANLRRWLLETLQPLLERTTGRCLFEEFVKIMAASEYSPAPK